MTQPSVALKRLFHLFKVMALSTLIGSVIGGGFSLIWRPQATPLYHSQVLISLTKVRRQKINGTTYINYDNGAQLTGLFQNNFKSPTTERALRQAFKQAKLSTALTQPSELNLTTAHNSSLIRVDVTDHKQQTAIKGANVAAKVAVTQFEKQYQLRNSRVLAWATSADRQVMTISRSEIMLKFMIAGMLLGFLWVFVRELWQRRVASK